MKWFFLAFGIGLAGCAGPPVDVEISDGGQGSGGAQPSDASTSSADTSASSGALDATSSSTGPEYPTCFEEADSDVEISISMFVCEDTSCTTSVAWSPQEETAVSCVVDRPCQIDGFSSWCLRECAGDQREPGDLLALRWDVQPEAMPLPLEPGDPIELTAVAIQDSPLWIVRSASGDLLGVGGRSARPPSIEDTAPVSLRVGEVTCELEPQDDLSRRFSVLIDVAVDDEVASLGWGEDAIVGGYHARVARATDVPNIAHGKWPSSGSFTYAVVAQ